MSVPVEVSDFEVAHELAQLLATSHPSSLDRERAERLDWILRAYREAGPVGVVAFVRGELGERKRSANQASRDLAAGISTYLEAEAKELAKIEAQVCHECGYAAGVHDPLACSRAVPR